MQKNATIVIIFVAMVGYNTLEKVNQSSVIGLLFQVFLLIVLK